MAVRPRLALVAVMVVAVAVGAYAATRSGADAEGDAARAAEPVAGGPAAALEAALAKGMPAYVLVRSET